LRSKAPLISVVIPTYNPGVWLRDGYASVCAQDWPNLEVLIVDDASNADIMQVLGSIEPHTRVIRHDVNRGVSAARNSGITSASGESIVFLDADDILSRDCLSQGWSALQTRRADVACPSLKIVELASSREIETVEGSSWDDLDLHRVLRMQFQSIVGSMFSRHLVTKGIGFDEGLWFIEDWQFWLDVMKHEPHVVGTSGVATARRHDANRTHNNEAHWTLGKKVASNVRNRHPGCTPCASAAGDGVAALRRYCYAADLSRIFGDARGTPAARARAALDAIRRDPATARYVARDSAWRVKAKLCGGRK
jgi:glycosyltransferase involved in cell wall biosynthesis